MDGNNFQKEHVSKCPVTRHPIADGHVENGGANPVSGYTVVNAENYEQACAFAAKNPMVLDGSGSVEVAEMIDM